MSAALAVPAIAAHVRLLHRLAQPLVGLGMLLIASFGEDPERHNPRTGKPGWPLAPKIRHFRIGDIDGMTRAVVDLGGEQHRNVYAPLAVFRPDLPRGREGDEKDIAGVLGLVADFDDAAAVRWAQRLPLPPPYVLETSHGRFQPFMLFDGPEPAAAVKPIAQRLTAFARCDHGTQDLSHVWRIPGTANWPSARKLAAGRAPQPQRVRVVVAANGELVALTALAAALPDLALSPAAEHRQREPGSAPGMRDLDAIMAGLPLRLRQRLVGPVAGYRSRNLMALIAALCRLDHGDDAIEQLIRAHPSGAGEKYVGRGDLAAEIARVRGKTITASVRHGQDDGDPSQPNGPDDKAATATGNSGGIGSPQFTPPESLPVIQILVGLRHQAADAGLQAMAAAGVPFYQRDAQLVRVCRVKAKASDGTIIYVPGIMPVRLPTLRRALGQSARWERVDKDGDPFRVDPPKEVAEQIAEMIEEWPFPPLASVIGCPTLRRDGSLLATPGYDEATGLVLHNGLKMPAIPERPTRQDALQALRFLDELLVEFPFADDESKSVARSAMITPVVRGAMSVAPMHLLTAPASGTGKSYLADLAATVATGERCAVIAITRKPEETENRLVGAALAGYPIIGLDNCPEFLEGVLLCQISERPLLQLRRLGSSDQIRVTNSFTVIANGNNTAVADDLVRRTMGAKLDANTETPEERTFSNNPLAMIRCNRGAYVAACLIACRAYIAAGRPGHLSDLVRRPAFSRSDSEERRAQRRTGEGTVVAMRCAEAWHVAETQRKYHRRSAQADGRPERSAATALAADQASLNEGVEGLEGLFHLMPTRGIPRAHRLQPGEKHRQVPHVDCPALRMRRGGESKTATLISTAALSSSETRSKC